MLRCTQAWLGRWSSRDFLRGRSKRAGAVHTRHTHGRQGRYKRLSSAYSSVRDGRRHAGNHMQGGLGIKLGGGLFGLRIPRQHQLSHMSKEEFDLEIYGHPNITNPYREHLDEHPDLKSVMMNAAVAVKLVVLLPRVSRHGDTTPGKWKSVAREVETALELLAPARDGSGALLSSSSSCDSAFLAVEVHFTTLETSVCCHWPSPPASSLEESVAQLYRAHCKLGQALKLEKTSATRRPQPRPQLPRRRLATFMGAALKAPSNNRNGSSISPAVVGAAPSTSSSFTSSVLAQLTRGTAGAATPPLTIAVPNAATESRVVSDGCGLTDIVHRLSTTEQPLLRVCIRPTSTHVRGPDGASSPAASSASPATVADTARKVLKADIDVNAEVGVWKLPKSPLQELLRWHYCAQDPRAHNHDALPHHHRTLPLLVIVDYSTADDAVPSRTLAASPVSATAGQCRGQRTSLPTTLMPRRLSLELESTGFKMVQEASLLSVAEALAAWSPAAQWERFTQSSSSSVQPEDYHGAACGSY